MATNFSAALQPSNSSDALFRAWAQFIHDTFVTTGGWTNTGDTGQVNLATVTAPAGANTQQGYKIYAMADTLQATYPVYLRVAFGSGAAANTPGLWITIGTGSDGSGNITGTLFSPAATPTVSANVNSATASNSYGSADTNRIQIALFVQTTARALVFSIERSKDSNGDDTGDGLIVLWNTVQAAINESRYIIYAGGSQPPMESGLQFILSGSNPSSFGSDVGVGVHIPIKGISQQPGYGCAIVRSSDFIAEATFDMTLYGNTITFQHLNAVSCFSAPSLTNSTARVCIRYD